MYVYTIGDVSNDVNTYVFLYAYAGDTFRQDKNTSDIIFGGVDQTGIILTIETRY